jgi:ribonuclease HI
MFLSPPSLQYAPAPPNSSLLSPAFQLVQWKPPLLACCLKLNFDGSVYHDGSGRASIGGVIRDNTGRVRAAFAERTEHAPPGIVEARALIRGLQLALRHFPGCWLVVEGDDLMLVKLLRGEDTERRIPLAMQEEIIMLLRRFPACEVNHIFREGNQVADALCHEAYQQPGDREWVGDVRLPQAVWEKARDDAQGVEYVRICKPKPPRCHVSIPSLVC